MLGEERNCSQWNLNHLPVDVLYHVSSFLDTRTILHSLRLVNKRFFDIFSDYSFWKSRIIDRRGADRYLRAENEDLWSILPWLRCPNCTRDLYFRCPLCEQADPYFVFPTLHCSYCHVSS
jgi:hypothetical protein